jgi:hypothetical protein
MQLNNITKVEEGLYSVESLPCPKCGDTYKLEIAGRQLHAYHNQSMVDEVLPDLSAEDRERFITGICPPCWDKMFEYEEMDAEFHLTSDKEEA